MEMTAVHIITNRLFNQQISRHQFKKPVDIVSWLGALQAQDYHGAKWSVGLRLPDATENDIDRAIAKRQIVRTWPMRGTLHFVAAKDIRWMLQLLTPRVIASASGRLRQLELDKKTLNNAKKIIIKTLSGDRQLERNELYAVLEKNGISTDGQRGIHILQQHALEGLICFAAHQGKQPAFALLEEWLPPGKVLSYDEALADLTLRYFYSHGPATLYDFAWWSGLRISEVKKGLQIVSSRLTSIAHNNAVYWMNPSEPYHTENNPSIFLLPGFDEYMLGYKDRSIILDAEHTGKIVPGNNGMFRPTIIINGRVKGTWQRTIKKDKVAIKTDPFTSISKAKNNSIVQESKHFAKFLDKALD